MDLEVSPLAAGWDWVSLSSRAHWVGHSRALLFKSAMALGVAFAHPIFVSGRLELKPFDKRSS
jgi:hypothetical protein